MLIDDDDDGQGPEGNAPIPCGIFRSDTHPLDIQEKDLESLDHLDRTNKQLFVQEMADMDLYLHNIHNGFRYATSVNAIGSLVRNALAVQRHRRVLMNHVSQGTPESTIDYDVMGNPVSKRKRIS